MTKNNEPSPQEIRAIFLRKMEEALDLYSEGKLNKHQLKWAVLGLGSAYINPRRVVSRFYE